MLTKSNQFHPLQTIHIHTNQNTALHLAAMENRPNAVALLLSLGCKLFYNNMDMSAIDYVSLVKLLR